MTVDIGAPTHTLTCQRRDCGRTVGPYHDPRQASAAMETHRWVRHLAIRPALPAITDSHNRGMEWLQDSTD